MQILDLSTKPHIKGAKHWYEEINQLYHPTGVFEQDSQEVVYSYGNLNTTKFVPVLLKEWFYLVKKDGYLVIDYVSNKTCDFQKLEKDMWWLWSNKYEIIFHGPIKSSEFRDLNGAKIINFAQNSPSQPIMPRGTEEGVFRFVCKKVASTKVLGDDVNKWTFGMITKGDRNEWIEEIIQAIHKQKIPNYEIIVCGTYFDRKEKNFTYIPFKERDDRGWITKKKNLIVKAAKYENLCIFHDRIVLGDDWFSGMKKYGNCFELLCNKQTLRGTTLRTGDWITYGRSTLNMPYSIAKLNYTDWDEYIYVGGMLTILKRHIARDCPWNETLYWGEEDVELTFRQRDCGYLARFNPYSNVTALSWRFGDLPTKYYRSEGFLPKDMLVRRSMRQLNNFLFSVPILKKIFFPVVQRVVRLGVYNFLTRH